MSIKLTRWLIFSVLMALLPLLRNFLRLTSEGNFISFYQLTPNGELLLIGAAISAAAIGELFGNGGKMKLFKIIAGGLSMIMVILNSNYFNDISITNTNGNSIQADVVSYTTIVLFFISIVSSGCCVALSEIGEK